MDINDNAVEKQPATDLNKSTIMTSLITSVITVTLFMFIFVFSFQPLKKISQNQQLIKDNKAQLEQIKQSIDISRSELELQVRDYIAKNYGELSERDEKVDKLLIYFRQQDARLSNIEEALSKF